MRTPGRILRGAWTAALVAVIAACGAGSAAPADEPVGIGPANANANKPSTFEATAAPTPGQLALVDPATLPRELTFFDHVTGIFVAVVVDPLDRDYGHVTVAIDGAGVAWSLEPGAIETTSSGLSYNAAGPARLDTGAIPDTLYGPNYMLSGAIEDATLAVDLAVEADLLTAAATIELNGSTYVFNASAPELDAGAVAEVANAALVGGDWQTIWEHLEADGQAKFTPEHWLALGQAFETEFDSIDAAQLVGVRYLVQPGILPFRAFADTTVVTTTNDVSTNWNATQKLVYERGAWRLESMGQMEEAR